LKHKRRFKPVIPVQNVDPKNSIEILNADIEVLEVLESESRKPTIQTLPLESYQRKSQESMQMGNVYRHSELGNSAVDISVQDLSLDMGKHKQMGKKQILTALYGTPPKFTERL